MRETPANQLYPAPAAELAWSAGRAARFRRCRREFLYHYVFCRGGWEPGQPEEIRRLYLLKQLTGFDSWLTRVLYGGVTATAGEGVPEQHWRKRLEAVCRRELGLGLRDAALELWRDDPLARLQLSEVRFREIAALDLAGTAGAALGERLERLWEQYGGVWRRLPRPAWRIPAAPLVCDYRGVTIYRGPALVWMEGGILCWLELRRGAAGDDAWPRYYAWRQLGVTPERVRVEFFAPETGELTVCRAEDCAFSATAEDAAGEALEMRDWLEAAVASGQAPERWRPGDDAACRRCRFREYCAEAGS